MMAVSGNNILTSWNPIFFRYVIIFQAMDYFIGFIFGYFVKETIVLLKKLSDWDYSNRMNYKFDLDPLTEDDLP